MGKIMSAQYEGEIATAWLIFVASAMGKQLVILANSTRCDSLDVCSGQSGADAGNLCGQSKIQKNLVWITFYGIVGFGKVFSHIHAHLVTF